MFDEAYVLKDAGALRVPNNAGFDPGMEIAVTPQQIAFANPIRPQQKGYIYIWVSNESENNKVWFDDLKVTYRSRRVTQATDYYAYGSVLREQKTPEELTYRYKYQGQYAEKDEETGWSHFELREYDPIVGRWTATDPYGQYYSPYIGMGNNPVSSTDPDGGLDDVYTSTSNKQTSIIKTNDNFDRVFIDGKLSAIQNKGWGQSMFSDARLFDSYNFDFYNQTCGAQLRDDNMFARLYKNAPSQEAQNNLFKASISNRDPSILYGTLALAAAPIAVGELLGAAATFDIATTLNTGNWWRLGSGWNPAIQAKNIRLAWGAHVKHLKEVPKLLRPVNQWLRKFGGGHKDFPNWRP